MNALFAVAVFVSMLLNAVRWLRHVSSSAYCGDRGFKLLTMVMLIMVIMVIREICLAPHLVQVQSAL